MSNRTRTMACSMLITMLAVTPVWSETNSDAGTAGFQFLKLGALARQVAMGGAVTADVSDASAMQANPAGLAQQMTHNWSASYSNLYTDVQSGFLAYSQPVGTDVAVVGLSVAYLTSSDIPKRDALNNDLGSYSFSDIAIALSAGARLMGEPDTAEVSHRRRMRDRSLRIDGGITVRGIYEKLDQFSASGIGVDAGVLFHLPDRRSRVGLAVTNLGKQTSAYQDIKDGLPTTFRAGLMHQLREAPFTFVGDIELPKDNKLRFGVGGELKLGGTKKREAPFALRGGFNSQGRDLKTTADDSGIAGFSFGAGFEWRRYTIDYSFTPGVGLGTLHRFTIGGSLY